MSDRIPPPDALIYAMVTVSAADRTITTAELDRISSIVRELPPFHAFTRDWLADTAQQCGKLLRKPDGVDAVIAVIKQSLPPRLYETAYVLCAEVAASDLSIHANETHFMELLAAALGLEKPVCDALERGARARHQRT
ncbi:tellurite resistance TerB family protein [Hyphomicrobium sp.]|uniref:tellurite resistance TerB family protein n=1 Tax=Hyphomicrobium sp. TaxID=82 RepID=UPI0025BE7086|nr:tellurite resistance TerB family protein [Hyphomicrobium sp.]MCC7251220.1 tellurite resistance TerB family protein [Hyphomicrobium sp.]